MIRKITALLAIAIPTLLTLSLMVLSVPAYAGTTPPTTVLVKTPSLPNGKNSWYVTPVGITLSSTDLNSGVATINYKVDTGNWVSIPKSDTLNLAPNPSFETEHAGSSINTLSWEAGLQDGQATYSRDPVGAAFDAISIKINSTGAAWHSINHTVTYSAAAPLSNMSAEVWFKTNSVVGTAGFDIYAVLQDLEGNLTYSLIDTSPTITGTNNWTKISKTFIVSEPRLWSPSGRRAAPRR